jgi:hypothetical protein
LLAVFTRPVDDSSAPRLMPPAGSFTPATFSPLRPAGQILCSGLADADPRVALGCVDTVIDE